MAGGQTCVCYVPTQWDAVHLGTQIIFRSCASGKETTKRLKGLEEAPAVKSWHEDSGITDTKAMNMLHPLVHIRHFDVC